MKSYHLLTVSRIKTLFAGLILLVFFIGATATGASAANGGELDASFVPSLLKENQAFGNSILIQPDGKILYAGFFLNVNQQPRSYIVRFNADGSLDSSFDSGGTFNIDAAVNSMALQPDGKIIVAGSFDKIGGQTRFSVVRLDADGSFDPTLTIPFPARIFGGILVAVQSDGKILLSGNFSSIGGQTRNGFARVNADGSLDTAFNPPCSGFSTNSIIIQPDGKILFGGSCTTTTSPGISRINANGTVDASFNPGTGANGSAVQAIALQADGKVLIGGQFTTFNGQSRRGIARLNADGSLDPTFVFTADAIYSTKSIVVQPDGKIVTARSFGSSGSNPVFRLNSDGSNDASFNASETQVGDINAIALQSDGKILEAGKMQLSGSSSSKRPFLRLNANGTIDNSLDPSIVYAILNFGVNNVVVQPDGKILAAGDFLEVNRQPRSALVRFNADGSLDTSFTATGVFNSQITPIALQPDGKIIVGSGFSIVRLNADGSNDGTFNVPGGASDTVKYIGLQPNGKILVAGNFNTIGGQTRNAHFARLNADGSVDAFNPSFGNGLRYVSSLLVQPDGKFLVSGDFIEVNGATRGGTVRFNADGTVDSTFINTDFGFSPPTFGALQPDGKIIAIQNYIVIRLNANGSFDDAFIRGGFFNPGGSAGVVSTVVMQADGKILVGGTFQYTVAPSGNVFRTNFARLNSDGSIDTSFGSYGGANGGAVYKIAVQADGKILLGGSFRMVNNFGHSGLARLNPAVFQTNGIADFDGDGKADAAVFRGGTWFVNPSGNPSFALSSPSAAFGTQFGLATDKLAPADFDGDGKTDIAVWREGALAYFYILNSSNNTFRAAQFGTTGDNPVVVGDWDRDGKADPAVYRAGTGGGQSNFYYRPSTQPTVDFVTVSWGTGGDKPMRGDFDGDGRLDAAVFRPSNGIWYIRQSSNGQPRYEQWGTATDKFVSGDFDGDGKTDLAVFRDGVWYIKQSSNNQPLYKNWGVNTDALVPADYDGDGRTDVAVFRNGIYYILNNVNAPSSIRFGASGDVPVAAAFVQ